MPGGDIGYLGLSFLFAGVVLALAELLRRRGWTAEASRKFVHIAVGHITIPLVLALQHQALAIAPAILFVVVNYLALRTGALPGMAAEQRQTLGTVYFPASLALLLATLWRPDHRLLVLGAMMLMTWGDGLAAVAGNRWGRRFWRIGSGRKSLAGSLAMLFAGFVSFFLSVWVGGLLNPALALRSAPGAEPLSTALLAGFSLVLAIIAMLLEGLSARGLDNLSVPLGAALVGLALLHEGPAAIASVALGLVLAAAVGLLAVRARALTTSGALGATLTGGLIFGLGGWLWGLLLIAFFASSSFLTHYRNRDKAALGEKFAKTGARDGLQVLANGGAATVLAVWHAVAPTPALFAAFLGILATVNADTWATELGSLAKAAPRLITTGRRVARGTSGGVTSRGTLASLAGALLIGLLAAAGLLVFSRPGHEANPWRVILATALGGLAGSLFDSLLGASVQAVYQCPRCGVDTEQTVHCCGTPAEHVRGLTWLDNDWVNLLSSLAGGLVAVLLF